jgi:hypothetical protein
MSNYTVIVVSKHDNVDCAGRRFKTKSDAERALDIDVYKRTDLIAEVSEIGEGDMSIRDEEPISFVEWCEEEVTDE